MKWSDPSLIFNTVQTFEFTRNIIACELQLLIGENHNYWLLLFIVKIVYHFWRPVSMFGVFRSHLIFRLHGAKCSLKACAMLWNIGMYYNRLWINQLGFYLCNLQYYQFYHAACAVLDDVYSNRLHIDVHSEASQSWRHHGARRKAWGEMIHKVEEVGHRQGKMLHSGLVFFIIHLFAILLLHALWCLWIQQ